MSSQALDPYIEIAHDLGASDLHLIANVPPTLRMNGEIILADSDGLSEDVLHQILDELVNDEQRARFEQEWELCISIWHQNAGRMRITINRRNGHPEFSVRFCGRLILTREELGLPPKLDELARRPTGLVLVTGPTGSGKTTTLNYLINLINEERRCKIVTIEDPIEYVHENNRAIIIQQEVLSDVRRFDQALIHVLRQDPDIIVVGELRDHETISTALTAAETGHLVMATMHSPNVINAIERIIGVFEGNAQRQVVLQLTNTLQGIIAQRLLPSADRQTRVLAYELVLGTPPVRRLIRDNTLHQLETIVQTNRKDGMVLMDNCLFDLYAKCLITYDTAMSHATDVDRIQRRTE